MSERGNRQNKDSRGMCDKGLQAMVFSSGRHSALPYRMNRYEQVWYGQVSGAIIDFLFTP